MHVPAIVLRAYAQLLRVYSREFRERFEAGMRNAFSEDYARAARHGSFAAVIFCLRTALHTFRFGIVERLPRGLTMRSLFAVNVRDAFRSLRATPVITAVAVLSLALGIGANTALFSIINGLFLKPLPVHEPHRLAFIGDGSWTTPAWLELDARQTEFFDSVAAWSYDRFDLASHGPTDIVEGSYTSGRFFEVLGVSAAIGRTLGPADDTPGGGASGPVAVISHRLWQQRYGGSVDAIGRSITVNRTAFTIVGVMPAKFFGADVGRVVDVYLPLGCETVVRGKDTWRTVRSTFWLALVARLKPGATFASSSAALESASTAIRRAAVPDDVKPDQLHTFLESEFDVTPAATGRSIFRGTFQQPLAIIMAVVGAVLLIACANIANVLLARASARRHEMSLRLALGATRFRLAKQLLLESVMLALAGGAAGLLFAEWGSRLLVHQLTTSISAVTLDLGVDWRVLGFTALVAIGTTLVFGLAPAIGMAGVTPNDALKEQGRSVTAGDRRFGMRNALLVLQVALSLTLVAGAGLFVRTFTALSSTPLGFRPDDLLIVNVNMQRGDIASDQRARIYDELRAAAAAVPGVRSASASFMTPISGRSRSSGIERPGGAALPLRERYIQVSVNPITPEWFRTYGMAVVAGRAFESADRFGTEPVAVVNEAFVEKYSALEGRSPLGLTVKGNLGATGVTEYRVVGVVANAVYRSARAGIAPTVFLPLAQAGTPLASGSLTLNVQGSRGELVKSLSTALARVHPSISFTFRDFSEQVSASIARERLLAMLSGFFGALAALVAGIGLYGVTSYSVNRRRSEIAVRMALGADAGGVVRLVLRRVAALIAIGVVIGAGISIWAGKYIETLLFGLNARDPITLALAAALLAAIGGVAGWLPARRASRLDPTVVLRT